MKNIDLTNHGSSLVPKPKMSDEKLGKLLYDTKKRLSPQFRHQGWDKLQEPYKQTWIEFAKFIRANKDII